MKWEKEGKVKMNDVENRNFRLVLPSLTRLLDVSRHASVQNQFQQMQKEDDVCQYVG